MNRQDVQSDAETTTPEAKAEGPRLMQVGDFLQDVGETPHMLVEELLPDFALIALASKPKFGKSLMALDMLIDICQGHPVFDVFTVNKPGPVVYLGMEDGKNEIANRLKQMGMTPGDTRHVYICADRFSLGSAHAVDTLKKMVAEIHPVLIVIDTARESLGIRDWANPGEVSDCLRALRDFAHEYCTVILITHNRKADGDNGDEISGTNAFTSSVDGWLSAWKKEKLPNDNVRLHVRREGRGGMRGEFVVEMHSQTLTWTALTTEQMAEEKQQQPAPQSGRWHSVLCAMDDNGGKTTAPFITTRLQIGERIAQSLLKEMAGTGLIADSGEREGPTRRTMVYVLTDKGKSEIRKDENTPTVRNADSDSDSQESDDEYTA